MDTIMNQFARELITCNGRHIIPYVILLANFIIFKLLRSLADYLLTKALGGNKQNNNRFNKLIRLLIYELISTCELCADCAELNVVYEKHGSIAYGTGLFLLSYLWIDAFGEAHTTPGYLIEEYFMVEGNQLLKMGETYARFLGQSIAMPLSWRFASFYWKYHLLNEHKQMLVIEDCKTALTTNTINGSLIEFGCCLLCRLIELFGQKLLEKKYLSQRIVSLVSSFTCTILVVLALEISGGYFNPILAASLEYGCQGIYFYQHALVFWISPLLGHIVARMIYKRYGEPMMGGTSSRVNVRSPQTNKTTDDGRPKRTTSRRKRHRD